MTYRELQTALKTIRNNGTQINCKLNAKKEILQSEYNRVTAPKTVETKVKTVAPKVTKVATKTVNKTVQEQITEILQDGCIAIFELRQKLNLSKQQLDKVLVDMHYADTVNLFTGEVPREEYLNGVFLPGIDNPRTWVQAA